MCNVKLPPLIFVVRLSVSEFRLLTLLESVLPTSPDMTKQVVNFLSSVYRELHQKQQANRFGGEMGLMQVMLQARHIKYPGSLPFLQGDISEPRVTCLLPRTSQLALILRIALSPCCRAAKPP